MVEPKSHTVKSNRNRSAVLSCLATLSLLGLFQSAAAVETKSATKPGRAVLTGGINQLVMLTKAAGVMLSAQALPAEVSNVRLGSTAAFSGVRQGDQVLDAKVEQNVLSLTLKRGEKTFLARMAIDAKSLKSMTPRVAPIIPKLSPVALPANAGQKGLTADITESEAEKILSDYNFIVLVDHSGSMKEQIHRVPGSQSGSTKLDWVKSNMNTFANFLAGHCKSGITLIPFNGSFQVIPLNSAWSVSSEVNRLNAEGGTNLGDPLDEAVHIALSSRKNQMIVVLSDGMSNLGPSLEETIIQATKVVPAGEVVASFLQIGAGGGEAIIRNLDDNLVSKGAAYDMVDAKYFSEIERYGLKRVLADAVLRAKQPR
jgi:Mg-chelatase subunit ChlD